MDTWKIRSPTIIYQDDLPELCMKRQWVLCLSNDWDTNELAEHLVEIYRQRKHDGLIFLGEQGHEQLLKKLGGDVPLTLFSTKYTVNLFSTNYPSFMPTSYKTDIRLRLDSNIIFYKENFISNYDLYDIFAVKGGPPITLEVGKWDIDNGMRLMTGLNRWDRRTDLKGVNFKNSFADN